MSDDPYQLADDVAEQDVPVGGAVDGHLASAAAAVLVQGIVTTRDMPTLDATFGGWALAVAGNPIRIGRNPQRRRLSLSVRSATATAAVVVADTEQQARSGYGLAIGAGQVVTLHYAGELWMQATGADCTLGFVAEIDSDIRADH